jgi:hypothetical protein
MMGIVAISIISTTKKYASHTRETFDGGGASMPTGGGNPKNVRTIITMTDIITALLAVEGVNLLSKDPLTKIRNQLTNTYQ